MESTSLVFMGTDTGGNLESKPRPARKGGRKPARKPACGKKREPQRGMGILQLERLRWEERWKRLTQKTTELDDDQDQPQPALSCPGQVDYPQLPSHATAAKGGTPTSTSTACGLWGWDTGFVLQRAGNNNGGFYGSGSSSGLSLFDPSWAGAPAPAPAYCGSLVEAYKELSSMPKLNQSVPPTHCEVCIKKKRFSSVMSRNLFEPVDLSLKSSAAGNYYNNQLFDKIINHQVFSCRDDHFSAVPNNNLGVDERGKKGEAIRASSVGSDQKMMEFEFFPGKNGRSTASKVLDFASSELGTSEGSSCAAAPAPPPGGSSNLVDLSLKLSY